MNVEGMVAAIVMCLYQGTALVFENNKPGAGITVCVIKDLMAKS